MKFKKITALLLAGALCATCTATALPSASAADGTEEVKILYSAGFEDGVEGWAGRGDATVEAVSTAAHSGEQSLFCTGRTKCWNGAMLESDYLVAGSTFTATCYVYYNNTAYSSQGFELNLQYDQGESQNYPTIARATGYSGGWVELKGEITIPADAENISMYVQTTYTSNPTEQDLMDFYIDDITFAGLPDPEIQYDIPSLKSCFSDYFKLGTAIMSSEAGITPVTNMIDKHFNSLTFGNELKPDSVLDQTASLAYLEETGDQTNPQISLAKAATLLNYAAQLKIPVRGHVLVWHSQTPDWFFKENYDAAGDWVSKEVMLKRMENYIKNVMQTLATDYPDVEFYAWDVVNEAFSETGTAREAGSNNTTSGQSAWVSVFGDNSFIEPAFEYARKYAPADCKLFYNDYNEYVGAKMNNGIIPTVTDLYEKGLLDGVGLQSHLDMGYPDAANYKTAIDKYAAIGCEIQITELDLTTWDFSENGFNQQATQYRAIFDVLTDAVDGGANITAVVLWGLTDKNSWRATRYPLLFDGEFQAKPSFYSIVEGREHVLNTKGDLNLDGIVNVADVVIMNRYLVNSRTLDTAQAANADMNGDGVINTFDAAAIKRLLVK